MVSGAAILPSIPRRLLVECNSQLVVTNRWALIDGHIQWLFTIIVEKPTTTVLIYNNNHINKPF